jgi:hypothetical protein
MDIHETAVRCEETIRHQMEDVLSCIDQKTQGPRKELAEKIDKTQVDLTGSEIVPQQADEETPGNRNRHTGSSWPRPPDTASRHKLNVSGHMLYGYLFLFEHVPKVSQHLSVTPCINVWG